MLQDQTVKVSEAQALEVEVHRLREENAELRRKNNEISSLEVAKKRAEAKVEALEQKVSPSATRLARVLQNLCF